MKYLDINGNSMYIGDVTIACMQILGKFSRDYRMVHNVDDQDMRT